MLLEDRVAIVSGIGPGLGRSIALALAREGAHVGLAARSEDTLAAVTAEVEALGRRAVWRSTDVARPEDCAQFVAHAVAELGGVDIVVNSAARGNTGFTLADSDLDDWRSAMEVSFFGALQLTQAALPSLLASDHASVVNIGTLATRDIQPRQGAYAAAKMALLTATKTLARELGAQGVRVNAVNPGYIAGRPIQSYFERQARESGGVLADYERRITDQIALGAIPSPDEIAGSVVYLASDLALPVTGHVIECNGGMWM